MLCFKRSAMQERHQRHEYRQASPGRPGRLHHGIAGTRQQRQPLLSCLYAVRGVPAQDPMALSSCGFDFDKNNRSPGKELR